MNVLYSLKRPHAGLIATLVLSASMVMGFDLYLQATTLRLELKVEAPDCCGDPIFTCPPICGAGGGRG